MLDRPNEVKRDVNTRNVETSRYLAVVLTDWCLLWMVSDGRTIKRLVIVVTIRCMFVMVALDRNECLRVNSGRASDCACRTMPNSHGKVTNTTRTDRNLAN